MSIVLIPYYNGVHHLRSTFCPIRYSWLWLMGNPTKTVIWQHVPSVTADCTWQDTRCFLGYLNNSKYIVILPYYNGVTDDYTWWDTRFFLIPHSSFLIPHSSVLSPQSSVLSPQSSVLILPYQDKPSGRTWLAEVQAGDSCSSICGLEISFSSVPQDIDIKVLPASGQLELYYNAESHSKTAFKHRYGKERKEKKHRPTLPY